ncbi:NAD(P)-binding protein [Nadsonia fulvescens var. elongata DSM 6958]|uniref:NAD(P)-binding protein n=1 Tax=Nadsonia fulvescens var. elongata DSM 6958 TaxID=857566 RepID=A0A1E3PFB5_9ASCO|nr:NAD(P)-binding protein [Nadsonia fulvescens var. elongata DSM 6958]
MLKGNIRDHNVSIDDIIMILRKTICHPLSVWVFAIILLANGRNYNDSVTLRLSLIYGGIIDLIYLLNYANDHFERIRSPPWKLDPLIDVAVVTGGCSGLGKYISAILAVNSDIKVAVLDIDEPKLTIPNVTYFLCDISDFTSVEESLNKVKTSIGMPTILINNAGITHSEFIEDLPESKIRRIFDVNVLSHFWTTRALLPGMKELNRGYIVTIASVLGYIAPARLTAYAATKAANIAFHESVTYELETYKKGTTTLGIKTLLVTPGQIDTPMFENVSTPSEFFAPMVRPEELAHKIVQAIIEGKTGAIRAPFYTNFIPLMAVLPKTLVSFLRRLAKVDRSIKDDSKLVDEI